MKNGTSHTKERILQVALDMFAERGFGAVSIRDICGDVGIKESTVYYHFRNKQDIFDCLLQQVEAMADGIRARFDERFQAAERVEREAFIRVGLAVLIQFLLDPYIWKIHRMLVLEQNRHPHAAEAYGRMFMDLPLQQNERVFESMMDRGYFKRDDAVSLSAEYYGLIHLTFQRYFHGGGYGAEERTSAEAELSELLGRFYDRYRREDA